MVVFKRHRLERLYAIALALVMAAGVARLAPYHPRGIPPVTAGDVRIIDGDTIDVGGIRVRLEGIDAPELGQRCRTWRGRPWDCGDAARRSLDRLIDGRSVACQSVGIDTYGRILAQCSVNGLDLGAELVRLGFAWAFLKYTHAYEVIEMESRARRVGVWNGDAKPPWIYRARRSASTGKAPAGCAIKGNVTQHGRVYHLPSGRSYNRTRIDEARGERWFCSENEAVAAGWRPAAIR